MAAACSSLGPDAPFDGLVWEWSDHRAWFTRFWTGECADRLEGCWEWTPLTGAPHWQAIMDDTLERAAASDRAQLRCRLFQLGRQIGHEWSRESQVRAFDAATLEDWSEILQNADGSQAIERAIDRIWAKSGLEASSD